VTKLGIRLEEEWDAEDIDARVDLRQSSGHQQRGVELSDPHQGNDSRLRPLSSVREDPHLDTAARRLLGRRTQLEQGLVPGGIGGREGRELDLDRSLPRCGGDRSRCRDPRRRANRHEHSRQAEHDSP
jgi:hypothetical protein